MVCSWVLSSVPKLYVSNPNIFRRLDYRLIKISFVKLFESKLKDSSCPVHPDYIMIFLLDPSGNYFDFFSETVFVLPLLMMIGCITIKFVQICVMGLY